MKIIDQYIYAIGQKLPIKGREDVKRELKSLLLDEIDAEYGENPSAEQVNEALKAFGSPGKVARRYSGSNLVIGSGFTDLYFLIFKILILAMSIAFFTIFIINLFTEKLSGMAIVRELGTMVFNIYNSSLSGIGAMTIIFIIITRFVKESTVDLEEDWTPKDLKKIPLGDEAESKIESFISIFFIMILLVIINGFPQLITLAETSFEKSGMILSTRVNLEQFSFYAILITIIWIAELVYHLLILKVTVKTKALKIFNVILDLGMIIILLFMVNDSSLFVSNPASSLSPLAGFKGIFIVILIISSIEFLVQSIKWAYRKIEK